MPNVYYDPEAFGLSVVGEVEFSSGYYEFDTLVVWHDEHRNLYYAEDSGCSCPSPFEDYNRQSITPIAGLPELKSRLDYRMTEDSWSMDSRGDSIREQASQLLNRAREVLLDRASLRAA